MAGNQELSSTETIQTLDMGPDLLPYLVGEHKLDLGTLNIEPLTTGKGPLATVLGYKVQFGEDSWHFDVTGSLQHGENPEKLLALLREAYEQKNQQQ